MLNFHVMAACQRLLLCTTALAVTVVPLTPCYSFESPRDVSLNDIATALRFEKLINKANKYFKAEDSKKLIEVLLDIKHETEAYTGQKIDISKSLDQVEKEIKARGSKISKAELKAIKNTIKKSEKKHNHKAFYMAAALENGCNYDDESIEVEWQYLCKSASKGKDKEEEMILPVRVTVGVTIALVGLFITILPFPPCKTWGPSLITGGVSLAIEGGCGKVEDDRKEEKNKKK
jgi:hypothetical protein